MSGFVSVELIGVCESNIRSELWLFSNKRWSFTCPNKFEWCLFLLRMSGYEWFFIAPNEECKIPFILVSLIHSSFHLQGSRHEYFNFNLQGFRHEYFNFNRQGFRHDYFIFNHQSFRQFALIQECYFWLMSWARQRLILKFLLAINPRFDLFLAMNCRWDCCWDLSH